MNPSVEVEVEAMLEVGAATETGRYCKVRIQSALVFARCGRATIGSDTLLARPLFQRELGRSDARWTAATEGFLRASTFPLLNPRLTNSFVSLTRSHVHP
jgi:hypothetical protein